MEKPRVRVIHETNPHKYFPAISRLADRNDITLVGMHRYSVVKEWLRAGMRERKPWGARSSDAIRDLGLRVKLPFLRGETIILGFAPWDFRVLIYGWLASRNRVIYHTSWADWREGFTPRSYGVFTWILRRVWGRFLRHPNVSVVAVLEAARASLEVETGVRADVIPHAVSDTFYKASHRVCAGRSAPLRLLFVGELSEKKGLLTTLDILASLPADQVHLTIVGDGPLRDECQTRSQQDNITFKGPIGNRADLAAVMAQQDILMLLSRKTPNWQELFGIVIVEALAAGLGVIASRHIGPQTIFEGEEFGQLFAETEQDQITALLGSLAQAPEALAAFKARQERFAEPYRLDVVADRWLACIRGSAHV